MVDRSDFNLDIFDSDSCLHLLCDTTERTISLPQRQLSKCPRVGLTLKRYDVEKEKYWMADYRYLSFPALHSKMKDYIVLSYIAKADRSLMKISELTATKAVKIEDLKRKFEEGREAIK